MIQGSPVIDTSDDLVLDAFDWPKHYRPATLSSMHNPRVFYCVHQIESLYIITTNRDLEHITVPNTTIYQVVENYTRPTFLLATGWLLVAIPSIGGNWLDFQPPSARFHQPYHILL